MVLTVFSETFNQAERNGHSCNRYCWLLGKKIMWLPDVIVTGRFANIKVKTFWDGQKERNWVLNFLEKPFGFCDCSAKNIRGTEYGALFKKTRICCWKSNRTVINLPEIRLSNSELINLTCNLLVSPVATLSYQETTATRARITNKHPEPL